MFTFSCERWVIALKNKKLDKVFNTDPSKLSSRRVCSDHFNDADYANFQNNRLKANAIPKLERKEKRQVPDYHPTEEFFRSIVESGQKSNDQDGNKSLDEEITNNSIEYDDPSCENCDSLKDQFRTENQKLKNEIKRLKLLIKKKNKKIETLEKSIKSNAFLSTQNILNGKKGNHF